MSSKQLINSADTRVVTKHGLAATRKSLRHSFASCTQVCGTAGIILLIAGRVFGHLMAPGNNEILAVLTWRSLSGTADDRKKVVEVHSIIFTG